MTREEQLKFCKKCTHRELDMKVGLICSKTGEMANFTSTCDSYKYDETVVEQLDNEEALEHTEVLQSLSFKDMEKFKSEQNYPMAILAGTAVAILGAILWATITVATEYQIGYMALAIGAAVGLSIRYTGKGIDQIFGITGAILAILGCLLGNFFSIIGFAAKEGELSYLETLSLVDYGHVIPLMIETFGVMDLLFYGIAAYEGYKFAFRAFTERDIHDLENSSGQ